MLRKRGIENLLIESARGGNNDAFQLILNKYDNYIGSRVNRYFVKNMDESDIYQEIVIYGFLKALDYYREEKGTKYITLVDVMIRNHFSRLINKVAASSEERSIDSNEELYNNIMAFSDEGEIIDRDMKCREGEILILNILSKLSREELEFLLEIFSKDSSMSKYSREKNISYGKVLGKRNKLIERLRNYGDLNYELNNSDNLSYLRETILPNISEDFIIKLYL